MIPKFRAWDKDKKWMVYDVQDAYDGLWSERNSDEINDYYSYVSTFQSFTDEEDFIFMQYTGLLDKNGVEIYEGDILEVEKNEDGTYKGTINGKTFFDRFQGYSSKIKVDGVHDINNIRYWNNHIGVIGNIYENAELLEEQSN